MRQARDDETGVWRVITEGIDNDGDGDYNEDGIGGLDLHRNYPENWRPDTGRDLTRRGWTQFGAGAFPLSEPETYAAVNPFGPFDRGSCLSSAIASVNSSFGMINSSLSLSPVR